MDGGVPAIAGFGSRRGARQFSATASMAQPVAAAA
jgi:hypothetical protein